MRRKKKKGNKLEVFQVSFMSCRKEQDYQFKEDGNVLNNIFSILLLKCFEWKSGEWLFSEAVLEELFSSWHRTGTVPLLYFYGLEVMVLTKQPETKRNEDARFLSGYNDVGQDQKWAVSTNTQVSRCGGKVRESGMVWSCSKERLRYVGHRMLKMVWPRKWERGRPNRSYMDRVKEDIIMEAIVKEKDVLNRTSWRRKIFCADH